MPSRFSNAFFLLFLCKIFRILSVDNRADSMSSNVVQPYFQTILQLLLTRLQNSPSEAFSQRFVRLYHLISSRVEAGLGADFFDGACEQLQAG